MSLESRFDPVFSAELALREKQIQQHYRPIIGVHKWFARRPGTLFRALLLAEHNGPEPVATAYWRSHTLSGTIADPFMGGGTTMYEANRLGFNVVGTDINPMAYWIVRQALAPLNLAAFAATAAGVVAGAEAEVGDLYRTRCVLCGNQASVKYFLWVKTDTCPICADPVDLFPGYLVATPSRHSHYVVACAACGSLNEYDERPTATRPAPCGACGRPVTVDGPARRQRVCCPRCRTRFAYPTHAALHPPRHRLWALEYHCEACKPDHVGRFFKAPDVDDLARLDTAAQRLAAMPDLPIPGDPIPAGDETDRLHRWGYRFYRDMFNERQLLSLGTLLRHIRRVADREERYALLTVFSDALRYQNMLARYDTDSLKCQDIFSVHGFPVGLVQCENNVLGIAGVGSGSFRHFVEKYGRAKRYGEAPFEIRPRGGVRPVIAMPGERIAAIFVDHLPSTGERQARLRAASATEVALPPASLDGVYTDPPYFDNVQYAELMDFCFTWLRRELQDDVPAFARSTTRASAELTGNTTLGRDLEHFTAGLAAVFRTYAEALKPGAPFVFTYHHNDVAAYVPLVVAILDAGLNCTATLPAVGEMQASLHIHGTNSSILDSVFVCRRAGTPAQGADLAALLQADGQAMRAGGVPLTRGDLACLAAGHVARLTINALVDEWEAEQPLSARMARAQSCLTEIAAIQRVQETIQRVLDEAEAATSQRAQYALPL